MNLEIWTKLPTKDKPFNTEIILEGLEESWSQLTARVCPLLLMKPSKIKKDLQSQMNGMVIERGGDQSGSG